MSTNKSDFFSFGNNLSGEVKDDAAIDNTEFDATVFYDTGFDATEINTSANETNGANLYTCSVCSAKISTPVCHVCGFDNSRNYEQNPTLQMLGESTPAVSLFKALWNPPEKPSAEQTLALIKNQKWDDRVLSAVEDILKRAESGKFTEQQNIQIKKGPAGIKKDTASASPARASQYCAVCGAGNDSSSLYCLKCGAKLNTFSSKKASIKTHGKYSKTGTKYCNQCGCKNSADSVHCAFCGAKIG